MGAKELTRFMDPDGVVYILVRLPSGEITQFASNRKRSSRQAKLDREIAMEATLGIG